MLLDAPLAIVDLETTGARKPRFDLDQYRILSRHLAGTRAAGRARIVELG